MSDSQPPDWIRKYYLFRVAFNLLKKTVEFLVKIAEFIEQRYNAMKSFFEPSYTTFALPPSLVHNILVARVWTIIATTYTICGWSFAFLVSLFLLTRDPAIFGQIVLFCTIPTLLFACSAMFLLWITIEKLLILVSTVLSIAALLVALGLYGITIIVGFSHGSHLGNILLFYTFVYLPCTGALFQWMPALAYQWHSQELARYNIAIKKASTYLLLKSSRTELSPNDDVEHTDADCDNLVSNIIEWCNGRHEAVCWLTLGDADPKRSVIVRKISDRCRRDGGLGANLFLQNAAPLQNSDVVASLVLQMSKIKPEIMEVAVRKIVDSFLPAKSWLFPFWLFDTSATISLGDEGGTPVSLPRDVEGIQELFIDPFIQSDQTEPSRSIPLPVVVVDCLASHNPEELMVFVNAIRKQEDPHLRVFIASNIAVYREHIAAADSTLQPMRSLHIGNELVLDSWTAIEKSPDQYKNLLEIVLQIIHNLGGIEGESLWNDLVSLLDDLYPLTVKLLKAQKTRKSLVEILKRAGREHRAQIDNHAMLDALDKDDTNITTILKMTLQSPSEQMQLRALRREDTQLVLDIIQTILDASSHFDNTDYRDFDRDARRLLISLSQEAGLLPSMLFVTGVTLLQDQPPTPGGFAEVYRGMFDGHLVAIKRLRHFSANIQTSLQLLTTEAIVWRQIKSPYIVPFLGVDAQTFQSVSLVSSWMPHGTIRQYIKLHPLNHDAIQKHLFEVAQGIKYLHSQNLVHGDLHGGNILINQERRACLSDFGLTAFAGPDVTVASTTERGARRWMAPELLSPEQFNMEFKRTRESDIYAFACICCEVFSGGRVPFFEIENEGTMVRKVSAGERPGRPYDDSMKPMPLPLWELTQMCWKHTPSERLSAQYIVDIMEAPNFT